MAQAFDIRPYRFDTRLENVDDFDGLQSDGSASKLAGSLLSIAERFADRFGLLHQGTLLHTGTLQQLQKETSQTSLTEMFIQLLRSPSDEVPG